MVQKTMIEPHETPPPFLNLEALKGLDLLPLGVNANARSVEGWMV